MSLGFAIDLHFRQQSFWYPRRDLWIGRSWSVNWKMGTMFNPKVNMFIFSVMLTCGFKDPWNRIRSWSMNYRNPLLSKSWASISARRSTLLLKLMKLMQGWTQRGLSWHCYCTRHSMRLVWWRQKNHCRISIGILWVHLQSFVSGLS